ncbi:TerB family tellurite resistance protein [Vibrio cholerae]|nr:TerB family tellurite resistance protein [Vibrio cholerae]
MFNALTSLFKQLLEGQDLAQHSATPELAIACLLSEVAGADQQISAPEQEVKQSASLYDFTSQLRSLSQTQRFELIKAMWEVANADGTIDPLEDAVIRKAAELLYVDHSQFIRAKLMAADKHQSPE